MYLLDTDTCIHLARDHATVLQNLGRLRQQDVHVSILTVYELEVGVRKSTVHLRQKRQALDYLMGMFAIAPFGHAEACEAARIRAELEQAGQPIGAIDYLIAGIARANAWTVVTGNLREFRRVKNLKAEMWHG